LPLFFHYQSILAPLAAVTAIAVLSATCAQTAVPTPGCSAPPGFARFEVPLKRVADAISAHQHLTIVAIGSSSTFGAGASSAAMSYPSRLAVELRALLPDRSIKVINRGVNGDTAREMLARFDRDVFAANPDLVLWQVGSNAVLLGRSTVATDLLIEEGLRRLKIAGPDVILIDPQYAPKVIGKNDEHDVDQMIALIHRTSSELNVNQFHRFALMRYWRLMKSLPFRAFLSDDELHMNDWSYGCIAKLLARAIVDAARMTVP
jgi:acyl-CoA thioesterase I